MSNEIISRGKEFLGAGLSVVLTDSNKRPVFTNWENLEKTRLTAQELEDISSGKTIRPEIQIERKNKKGDTYTSIGIKVYKEAEGLAIICGAVSGNLEVIDVDSKYDITGSLWDRLKNLIEDNLSELYNKLVIAQTKSGGYHIYYRSSSIAGNLKLANRSTTPEEREETCKKEIESGADEETAKRKANNDKVRVLIETRGEGGYVIAPPTPGYKYLQGEPGNIPTISPAERDTLMNIAKSFNELEEVKKKVTTSSINTTSVKHSSTGQTSYEDYNNRGDLIELIKKYGYSVVSETGDRVNILRPGQTDSTTSGNFHKKLRTLRLFSTSDSYFDSSIAYSPAQAFCILECKGDEETAYRRLLERGYGEPGATYKKLSDLDYVINSKGAEMRATQVRTEKIRVDIVNPVNRESSVISEPGGSLKLEDIKTAIGEEVIITSPGEEAQDEVLKAIALLQEKGKRIFIIEAEKEIVDYKYQLNALFKKYGEIQDETGLTDRDIHSLQDEILYIGNSLQPIDRDIFIKFVTDLKAIKDLGITQESLSLTLEQIRANETREAQTEKLQSLLEGRDIKAQLNKGDIKGAIQLIEDKLQPIKAIGDLLTPPISYSSLMDEIATLPPAYSTGYKSLNKIIGFTPGAVTLIAGRPSHGKTTFMFNLLLQMSGVYKDERFYFFSYEEPLKNIAIKILNRLTDAPLNDYFKEVKDLAKPTNYEFLKHYIKAQRTDIAAVEEGKRKLKELIDSQRVRIIDKSYSVEDLSTIVTQISKKEKVGAIFIDYIQRMSTQRKTQDKRTEIAHISDKVKDLAKDTGLPLILGAQLNRDAKGKPSLENLKEAGNLEEDANSVISVYCKARETEETEEGEKTSKQQNVTLTIKTLKNREGEVNAVEDLNWDRWTGVIRDPLY